MEAVAPRLGFRLVRIEVGAPMPGHNPSAQLEWRTWASDDEDLDTVVLGYLRCDGPTGFGQARCAAIITGRSFRVPGEGVEDLDVWIQENVTEHLYDLSRRAINSTAASMDITLEIATKAPDVTLEHLPDSTTSDDEPSG